MSNVIVGLIRNDNPNKLIYAEIKPLTFEKIVKDIELGSVKL